MTYQEYMDLLQQSIKEALERGINPWQAPWDQARNGITNKNYRGINNLLLSIVGNQKYDNETRWYTFDQARVMGCAVKKGEKATPAFFFQTHYLRNKKDENNNVITDENGNPVREEVVHPRPVFRVYSLFNAKQLDPVPQLEIQQHDQDLNIALADKFIEDSPVPIQFSAFPEAFYSSEKDSITMPPKTSFSKSIEEFYSTVFHEMIHSTGASDRLNRSNFDAFFGSKDYAKEELIAEISSLFLCEKCNIRYSNSNSAAYIANWLEIFKDTEFDLSDLYADVSKAVRFIEHPEDRNKLIERARETIDNPVENSALFKIHDGYLYVQHTHSAVTGVDYTIYDATMHELDGGVYETDQLSLVSVANEILKYHDLDGSVLEKEDESLLETLPHIATYPKLQRREKQSERFLSPVVVFTNSDYPEIIDGHQYSLLQATDLIASINKSVINNRDDLQAKKTIDYEIHFTNNDVNQILSGRYVIGKDDQTLLERILSEIKETKKTLHVSDDTWGNEYLNVVLPYLDLHLSLDRQEQNTNNLLLPLLKNDLSTVEKEYMAYGEAMLSYVREQRARLNEGKVMDLLHIPQVEDYQYLYPEDAKSIKKVYISGPITADPEYAKHFKEAEEALRSAGYEPINPIEIVKGKLNPNASVAETWREAMELDLEALSHSDAVALLDKKNLQSLGMDIEIRFASRNNIPVVAIDHLLEKKRNIDAKETINLEQPVVRIETPDKVYSDLTLDQADAILLEMNKSRKNQEKLKVDFEVRYRFNGKRHSYKGFVTIDEKNSGSIRKGIVENIRSVSRYMSSKTEGNMQKRWSIIEKTIVPYLKSQQSKAHEGEKKHKAEKKRGRGNE